MSIGCRSLLIAVAVAAVAGGYVYVARIPVPLDEALEPGLVQAHATGGGNASFRLSLSATSGRIVGLRIAVPSGMRFSSGQSGYQAMAVARAVVLDVPAAVGTPSPPQSIDAYCINRFLTPPGEGVSLIPELPGSSGSEEREPIRKLIQCLEREKVGHKEAQMAIWVVEEGLLDKPASQVVKMFRNRVEDEMVAEVERKLASQESLEALRREFPDVPEETIRERIALHKSEIARREVSMLIENEIKEYQRTYWSLLKCGYDGYAPFFQGG